MLSDKNGSNYDPDGQHKKPQPSPVKLQNPVLKLNLDILVFKFHHT